MAGSEERFRPQERRLCGGIFQHLPVRSWSRCNHSATFHTLVPTRLPIAAVGPIAKAPQKTTRATGRRSLAPPALAPTIPSRARNASASIFLREDGRALRDRAALEGLAQGNARGNYVAGQRTEAPGAVQVQCKVVGQLHVRGCPHFEPAVCIVFAVERTGH